MKPLAPVLPGVTVTWVLVTAAPKQAQLAVWGSQGSLSSTPGGKRAAGYHQVGLPKCKDCALSPTAQNLTAACPSASFCTLRMGSQGSLCVALACMMGKLRPRESESESQGCHSFTLTSAPSGFALTYPHQDGPPSWTALFPSQGQCVVPVIPQEYWLGLGAAEPVLTPAPQ